MRNLTKEDSEPQTQAIQAQLSHSHLPCVTPVRVFRQPLGSRRACAHTAISCWSRWGFGVRDLDVGAGVRGTAPTNTLQMCTSSSKVQEEDGYREDNQRRPSNEASDKKGVPLIVSLNRQNHPQLTKQEKHLQTLSHQLQAPVANAVETKTITS
eukprot:2591897-Amphidinium_carterae.1